MSTDMTNTDNVSTKELIHSLSREPLSKSEIETKYFENLGRILEISNVDPKDFKERFLQHERQLIEHVLLNTIAAGIKKHGMMTVNDDYHKEMTVFMRTIDSQFSAVNRSIIPDIGLSFKVKKVFDALFSKRSGRNHNPSNPLKYNISQATNAITLDNHQYYRGSDISENFFSNIEEVGEIKLSELPTIIRYLQASKSGKGENVSPEIVSKKSTLKPQIALPSALDTTIATLYITALTCYHEKDLESTKKIEIHNLLDKNMNFLNRLLNPDQIAKKMSEILKNAIKEHALSGEGEPGDVETFLASLTKKLGGSLDDLPPYQIPKDSSGSRILEKADNSDSQLIQVQNTFIAEEIKRVQAAIDPANKKHIEIVNCLMTGKIGNSLEVIGGSDIENWQDGFSEEQIHLRKKVQDLVSSESLSSKFTETSDPLLVAFSNTPLMTTALYGTVNDVENLHTIVHSKKVTKATDVYTELKEELSKTHTAWVQEKEISKNNHT